MPVIVDVTVKSPSVVHAWFAPRITWPLVLIVVAPAPVATATPPAPSVRLCVPPIVTPAGLVTRTLPTDIFTPSTVAGRLPALPAAKMTSVEAPGSVPTSVVPAASVAQLVLPALLALQLLLTSPRQYASAK